MDKIRVGVFSYYLRNGGRARITSLLLNYLHKINIFNLFLFTRELGFEKESEYYIENDIIRISKKNFTISNLIKEIRKKKIDILIFQHSNSKDIKILSNLTDIKTIFYQHQSFFFWLYKNYSNFKSIYEAYHSAKYIVSLIHLENDYIFRKWGIESIFMNNFISYNLKRVIPSDLSYKNIIMIGRADNKLKRFNMGINAMEYITQEIPECEMKILSEDENVNRLLQIMEVLNLKNNVKFYGYTSLPEIFFKNVSLHIFPSISESFGLVLCETKIYSLPSIILGLDYISIYKGGTINIYDDSVETIAKEAIKILLDDKYRKILGKSARKSIKILDNELLLEKWIKLILSVYFGNNYYQKLRKEDKKISEIEANKILYNQIYLLKMRKSKYTNVTINNINNFTYMDNLDDQIAFD
jgi:glycosyltransferase involved in cell wall biosynthesis